MRGDGAIADVAEDLRQRRQLVVEAFLELHRDPVDREAGQDLELRIGSLAGERGRERMGVAALGPELHEAGVDRLLDTGSGERHRIPEGLLEDQMDVAQLRGAEQRARGGPRGREPGERAETERATGSDSIEQTTTRQHHCTPGSVETPAAARRRSIAAETSSACGGGLRVATARSSSCVRCTV